MSRSSLLLALVASAFAAATGAVACSSNPAPADPASGACTSLDACCAAMSGPEQSTCQSSATAARQAGDATCASILSTLAQAGGCGGENLDAGRLPDVSAPLPCALTGTCPATTSGDASFVFPDASPGSGNDASVECEPAGTCTDGESFEACVSTSGQGGCFAVILFSDGTSFACASCTDCAAASAQAEAHCGSTPTPVPDAGPDCGSSPALHPEDDAGVYCPFTSAGAVYCGAGQQCCETPATVANGSTCEAAGSTCPVAASLAWECDGPLECAGSAGGPVCCAAGTVQQDAVCGYDRGTGFTGSHCAASCAAGEVTVCDSTQSECTSGTCTPFKVAGVVLGACL